jgi:hypothetical protein
MSPSRRFSPRSALAAVGGLVAAAALSFALPSSPAFAGDPAPAAVPAVSPRQAALEAVIHRLERHLAFLRKSRTELESGRPEPVPADDVARHRAEVDQRGVREISRYEAARAKAVTALAEAEVTKDAAKIGDAKAALDTLDSKFVDGMKRLEESLDAPPSPLQKAAKPSPADGAGDGPTPKSSSDKDASKPPPKKPAKGAGMSSSETAPGGAADDASDGEDDDDTADDEFAIDYTGRDAADPVEK